jgi:hypothetical protein
VNTPHLLALIQWVRANGYRSTEIETLSRAFDETGEFRIGAELWDESRRLFVFEDHHDMIDHDHPEQLDGSYKYDRAISLLKDIENYLLRPTLAEMFA